MRTGEAGFVVSPVVVAVTPLVLVPGVITNATGDDVDGLKAAGSVGTKTAFSEREPTANVDVVPDAMPLLTGTRRPRFLVPSRNCTVPAAAAGVIVAVNVTGVPTVIGEAGEVVNVVLVAVAVAGVLVTKANCGDVDGAKAVGSVGVNTAVSWCGPIASSDVVPDATPLPTITGLPRSVAPSLNCTVPTAVAGVTVAVSVTGVFWATGEGGEAASVVVVTVGSMTVNSTADDVDEL